MPVLLHSPNSNAAVPAGGSPLLPGLLTPVISHGVFSARPKYAVARCHASIRSRYLRLPARQALHVLDGGVIAGVYSARPEQTVHASRSGREPFRCHKYSDLGATQKEARSDLALAIVELAMPSGTLNQSVKDYAGNAATPTVTLVPSEAGKPATLNLHRVVPCVHSLRRDAGAVHAVCPRAYRSTLGGFRGGLGESGHIPAPRAKARFSFESTNGGPKDSLNMQSRYLISTSIDAPFILSFHRSQNGPLSLGRTCVHRILSLHVVSSYVSCES